MMTEHTSTVKAKDMAHINAGALDVATGDFFATKRDLSAALRERPHEVELFSTSPFGPSFRGSATSVIGQFPRNIFSIPGPDPKTNRKWYATVKLNTKSEIKCT